jgi:alkyl hydroperoxide reductase subunit F
VKGIRIESEEEGRSQELPVEGVFIEVGLIPNSELVRGVVELNDEGEIIVDCACRTSVPGIFAAGDVTTVPEKQIIVAAGEGAKAALSAYQYLLRMKGG